MSVTEILQQLRPVRWLLYESSIVLDDAGDFHFCGLLPNCRQQVSNALAGFVLSEAVYRMKRKFRIGADTNLAIISRCTILSAMRFVSLKLMQLVSQLRHFDALFSQFRQKLTSSFTGEEVCPNAGKTTGCSGESHSGNLRALRT